MRYFCITVGFLFLLITCSCGSTPKDTDNKTGKVSENKTTQTFFIGPQQVDCDAPRPNKCLLIKDKPSDEWRDLHTSIRGLNYQEGYTYKVLVNVTKIQQPAPDQHPLVYELVKLISKEQTAVAPALASDLKMVVYEAHTRGSFLRVEVDNKQVRYYKMRNDATPTSNSVSANTWKTIQTSIDELDVPAIATLIPPSNRRATDGALSAQITITNKKGEFVSSTFDHQNPPKALESLSKQLLSMIEGMD